MAKLYAKAGYKSDCSLGMILWILGHENRTTTEIYLHSMEGSERLAINALEVGLFSKSPTQSPYQKKRSY